MNAAPIYAERKKNTNFTRLIFEENTVRIDKENNNPSIEPKNIACEIVCVEPPSARTFVTVGLYCKTPYAPVIAMEKTTEKKNSPYCFRLFLKSFLLISLSVIPITVYLSCEVQQFVKKVFRASATHQFAEYDTVL